MVSVIQAEMVLLFRGTSFSLSGERRLALFQGRSFWVVRRWSARHRLPVGVDASCVAEAIVAKTTVRLKAETRAIPAALP